MKIEEYVSGWQKKDDNMINNFILERETKKLIPERLKEKRERNVWEI